MKTRDLFVACALGLLATSAAHAAFVEGTVDLDQLRHQTSRAATEMPGQAYRGGAEESIYELLAAQQRELKLQQASGVAGRAGDEMDFGAPGHGEESIYDRIRRDFN